MTNGTLTILRTWDEGSASQKDFRRWYECQVNVTAGATPITLALTDLPDARAWLVVLPFIDSAGAVTRFTSIGALTAFAEGFYPTGTLTFPNIAATGNGLLTVAVR